MNEEIMSKVNVQKEWERVPDPAELRVKATTNTNKLASAIISKFKDSGYAQIRAIGNGAIGVAVKAIAVARGDLTVTGINIVAIPTYFEVELKEKDEDGKTQNRTGITLSVEDR